MAPDPRDQKWYSIAEQASKETDSAKLRTLVAELCSALDDRGNLPALETQFCARAIPAMSMCDR
jgi:hypothetical protein